MRISTATGDKVFLGCKFTVRAFLFFFLASTALKAQYSTDRQINFNAAPDVYVPIDSWAYSALDRLHGLGYLDTAFLGIRPWTRRSIVKVLIEADSEDGIHEDPQAEELFTALTSAFPAVPRKDGFPSLSTFSSVEEEYFRINRVNGQPLRDSFHLGQTLANDYQRPYEEGLNAVTGGAMSAQAGRFSLYARLEYQHAPSAVGYSSSLGEILSSVDRVPISSNPVQATIPVGPIASRNDLRVLEANISYHILAHQISVGKSDHWLSPTKGGAFLYSNNAENLYSLQIDRVDPMYVPLLSRLTGPFRYLFVVGSVQGHTDPNAPWLHLEKISFQPTTNLEIGFSRATIWGGKGHAPITVHTFLKSFFSFQNTTVQEKFSREDPGARFGAFDFTWRLPFARHWLTLYTDSLVHDDVSPIDAPRHAGVRSGLFLSELPGLPRLDLRVEGVNTDPPTSRSNGGSYLYAEAVQLQGYTNKGFLIGDASGREGKGGQFWIGYHLSPRDKLVASFKNLKVAKDFVPFGVTQNSYDVEFVKMLGKQCELSADAQHEWWTAPIYRLGQQNDTSLTFQLKLIDPTRRLRLRR